jgi:hypothetical protein
MSRNLLMASLWNLVLVSSAWAGIGTHGGNVVVCDRGEPLVLDYYHATLPTLSGGRPTLISTDRMSQDEVVALIVRRLSNSVFALEFEAALAKLGSPEGWIATSLQQVPDSDEPYILPPGCQRLTGAARQGEEMYVDPQIYRELSPAQRGFLIAHEALYFASKQGTSTHVRELMRVLLASRDDTPAFVRAVQKLGRFYPYEGLALHTPCMDGPLCSNYSAKYVWKSGSTMCSVQFIRPAIGAPVTNMESSCIFLGPVNQAIQVDWSKGRKGALTNRCVISPRFESAPSVGSIGSIRFVDVLCPGWSDSRQFEFEYSQDLE